MHNEMMINWIMFIFEYVNIYILIRSILNFRFMLQCSDSCSITSTEMNVVLIGLVTTNCSP